MQMDVKTILLFKSIISQKLAPNDIVRDIVQLNFINFTLKLCQNRQANADSKTSNWMTRFPLKFGNYIPKCMMTLKK